MANKHEAISKSIVKHPCWVCPNNVQNGALGCEGCGAWAHAKCVYVPGEVVEGINNRKRIRFDAECDSCGSKDYSQKERMKEVMEIKHKMT